MNSARSIRLAPGLYATFPPTHFMSLMVGPLLLTVAFTIPADNADAQPTMTKIGNPAFDIVDVHVFTGSFSERGFVYLEDVLLSFVPHLGYIYDSAGGPDPVSFGPRFAEPAPYDTELSEGIVASGYKTGGLFNRRDLAEGLMLVYTGVPNAMSPVGSTPDYKAGPALALESYPYTDHRQAFLEGNQVFENEVLIEPIPETPGNLVDAKGNPIWFAGLLESHWHYFSYLSAPPDVPDQFVVGNWDWQLSIVDVDGNGWELNVPFEVVPESGSLGLAALAGLALMITRRRVRLRR